VVTPASAFVIEGELRDGIGGHESLYKMFANEFLFSFGAKRVPSSEVYERHEARDAGQRDRPFGFPL
jgi:hypothetical protein